MKLTRVRTLVSLAAWLFAGATAAILLLNIGTASLLATTDKAKRLHITKECHEYNGAAGSFCTITGSNISRVPIGTKVFYDQPGNIPAGLLDSNVVLDAGHGNRAVGRCTLDMMTGVGLCAFSDGTGRLAGFEARIDVKSTSLFEFEWNGTYGVGRDRN
jgi:hypothetical protein